MDSITICMAYFNQPNILLEWWRTMRTYAEPDRVKLRICDDNSKTHPLVIPDDIREAFDVMAFRVLDDIDWNEMGARNLCMKHSEGWVYLTDPDYLLTAENMRRVLAKDWKVGNYYHLQSRLAGTGKPLHMPENMAVLHTKDFWKAGGYDEDFAGGYGFSDCMLFKCLRDGVKAKNNFVKDVFMHHYHKGTVHSAFVGGEDIEDAASPAKRCTKRNSPSFDGKLALIRQRGIRAYQNALKPPIRFKWERVV